MRFGYAHILFALFALQAGCGDGALATGDAPLITPSQLGLAGTWRASGGAKIGNSPRDTEGIELTAKTVEFLHPIADGSLVGSQDFAASGTVDVEGSGPWTVVFHVGASKSTFTATVSGDGMLLDMNDHSRGVASSFTRER